MVKAPSVTSLRIDKLSANQVYILWDSVGSNFYYFVELTETRDSSGNEIDEGSYVWRSLGYTPDNNWFEEGFIIPLTYYKMRVSVASEGFERSSWVTTEEFQTFETNAYTFEMMKEFSLTNKLINEKFVNNNQSYIDFNKDSLVASLMSESFQYSPTYEDISSVSNYILQEDRYHEIQGDIQAVCVDKDRTMLAESNGILYLFERFQPVVKVSNDKGQNWVAVKLFNDRIGNPVSRVCTYQTVNTTYVLGYDRVFYGRPSNDIRWSADDVKMSSQDVTFAKLGDQLKLGFDVEIFGSYARLPGDVSKYVEAMACTDDFLYVVSRDVVRYVKLKDAPIDLTPGSPSFGEKIFEDEVINITGNPKAVCYKMDTIDGKLFALITGEVKTEGLDPTNPENVVTSNEKGIYVLEGSSFRRVYGDTFEERRRIEHGVTSMSTDGVEMFFSSNNFRYNDIIADQALVEEYSPVVTSAVKFAIPMEFLSDKHYHMMTFRSNSDSNWEKFEPGPMNYYAEPFFSWMKKSGTRSWITTSDKAAVIYSDVLFQKVIDNAGSGSPNRVLHETWNKGSVVVNCPNISFNGFIKYAGGILIHKNTGELVGYFEFNYRVRDTVTVQWKPELVMFSADLQNQTRETEWTPETGNRERDPDLRPLLNRMIPDSYLLQDSNFEKFCEYYLQFISDGYGTHYNNLLNLIRNKYPREEHAWEYLWSEIYKRNIYLSKDYRDKVTRFFEARKADFYSTKGIEASYKFLFKVLYNEDVEIDMESKNTTEYDIVVESNNISQDLVGRTIYTATGRSNVTYVDREYVAGKLRWRITIHNLIGRFIKGQEIKSEKTSFEGMIVEGVKGKELTSNNIDYINRNRSYYVMKIKSVLPTSRYREDVLRFVHPVGFGFIGVTLLTMFINAGLDMKHVETIINKYKNYKWSSGLPSVWYDRTLVFDANGVPERNDITGEIIYYTPINAGQPFPLRPDYIAENDDSILYGQNPDQRRKPMSPLFDQSAVAFSNFRDLVNERLKDNVGNPRDPEDPTQIKIGDVDPDGSVTPGPDPDLNEILINPLVLPVI